MIKLWKSRFLTIYKVTRYRRWVIEFQRWKGGVGIDFARQLTSYVNLEEWSQGSPSLSINLTKFWFLGSEHKVNSTHCSFSIGFIHIIYRNDDCICQFDEDLYE